AGARHDVECLKIYLEKVKSFAAPAGVAVALSGGLLQKNLLTTAENYRGHYSTPSGYNISQKFINSKASSFTNIYGPVRPGSRGFQTPASEMMNSIIDFHNDFMM